MAIFDRRQDGTRKRTGISVLDDLMEQLESESVPGRQEILDRFAFTEHEFNVLYASYRTSLALSHGASGGWNEDVDDFARRIGALSDEEIEAARKSLHETVLNRIKLRLIASARFAKLTNQ